MLTIYHLNLICTIYFITSEDLHKEVSEQFRVKYLSNSTKESDEVKGKFVSNYHRPFGVMTMEIKGQVKIVHFLVVTGTSKTYICKEVLDSYSDLNILDLHLYKSRLFIDYDNYELNFIIRFNDNSTEIDSTRDRTK
ncbi:uncharacterized protein OCT59_004607 [Rhizophagus irregularis]|uniref:uncharacterized protein n=1 Tax=Rhizophagus irregularis TaxID=588596 RepID=UPI00331CF4F3|nr:hypothetical protein OCT59_004607 [Rhizophagus irregularis]